MTAIKTYTYYANKVKDHKWHWQLWHGDKEIVYDNRQYFRTQKSCEADYLKLRQLVQFDVDVVKKWNQKINKLEADFKAKEAAHDKASKSQIHINWEQAEDLAAAQVENETLKNQWDSAKQTIKLQAEGLQERVEEISMMQCHIDDLEKKLKTAEKQADDFFKNNQALADSKIELYRELAKAKKQIGIMAALYPRWLLVLVTWFRKLFKRN